MTSTDPITVDAPVACRISPTVDLLFSRWTTPILWTLHRSGRLRFGELERQLGTITPKVLTERLRQLERDGLVRRQYFAEVPPRVEYEITELGRSLSPVFAALAEWTDDHLHAVEHAQLLRRSAPAVAGGRSRPERRGNVPGLAWGREQPRDAPG